MLAPGTTLGQRYSLIRTLGRGGMGAVYLARALEHPDLPPTLSPGLQVAVKQVLSSHLQDQERQRALAAFEQEANLLLRLRHENLVRVIEHLSCQGDSFLVMEYIEGMTLAQALKRISVPLLFARIETIARQLFEVLGYLHGLEPAVIFRDLKPGNIMIDRSFKVTLIDFGIARVFEEESETQTCLRGVGSAGYAPLEQYTGGTDPRSDLYSLGATLYHLMTLKAPPPPTLRVVGEQDLEDILQLNPQVPALWARAVLKMMRVKKAERFASIEELRRVLDSSPEELEDTTRLLESPQRSLEIPGALLGCRYGKARPEVAFDLGEAPLLQCPGGSLPGDLVLVLRRPPDELCGLHLVLPEEVRKVPRVDLAVEGICAYFLPEGKPPAPPQQALPLIRFLLKDFAARALEYLRQVSADSGLLSTVAQLSALLTEAEAQVQAAHLEMAWRRSLKLETPMDWLRLAARMQERGLEAAGEFRKQAVRRWQEEANTWHSGNWHDWQTRHQEVLEALMRADPTGQCCAFWLQGAAESGRSQFGLVWLEFEGTWRERLKDLDPEGRAECWRLLAEHWMAQAEYAQAQPLASQALELAERTLGPDNPRLSPYLRLYANVCDHCGMARQSTEYRTRALLLKHRRG